MDKNKSRSRGWMMGVLLIALLGASASGKEVSRWFDPSRHLPIEKVQPGMTGYGLTIFYGTKAEKFEFKVLDIIHNMEPQRDFILIQASGHDLERTGIVHGMSGSPAYLRDPGDGKYKLIGAVAFGWDFSREGPAICGIQPIEQMLAVPPEKPAPETLFAYADQTFTPLALEILASPKSGEPRPLKEFDRFCWAGLVKDPGRHTMPGVQNPLADLGLKPLSIPLGVSGLAAPIFSKLSAILYPLSLIPVKTGTVSSGSGKKDPLWERIVPAGVLSIPLVTGDLNLEASGTVTEVIGDRFWGFGHPFFNEGPLELPVAGGKVHAFIPYMPEPFKLSSPGKIVGTLYADQGTGVAGKVGSVPKSVPITIQVDFCGEVHRYHYNLAIHPKLAALLTAVCLQFSILAHKDLPELHVVQYNGYVEFEGFGKASFANTTSDTQLGMLLADVCEPINLMLNNEFKRVKFTGINVNVTILPRSEQATILQAKLDKTRYKPGETARVELRMTRIRGPEFAHTLRFTVPADLEDDEYDVTVGGINSAITADRRSSPFLYNLTRVEDVFTFIQRIESFRADKFYVIFDTNEEGLGVRSQGLRRLPGSKLQQLQEADPALARKFSSVRMFPLASPYVISGQSQLKLVVSRNP